MSQLLTGGCLCGAVRFAASGAPMFTGNCHCRDCQRSSGSGFTPALFFLTAAVQVDGEVKYYESQSDRNQAVHRGFCPHCGSQLFSKLEMMPTMLGLRAGTLDDPAQFSPQMDIYTASAAPWDTMNPALPKFPGAPNPA
jgi:hypothetical protein